MAVIDVHGLMDGKRLRQCSKQTRLWWPYFYLMANGYGRIELDYDSLVSRFFSFGDEAPTAEDIKAYFAEYERVHLAFIYQPNGQQWAQWDSKASNQKRFKTTQDNASPAPPEAQYRSWLKVQHGDKWREYHWDPKAALIEIPEIPLATSQPGPAPTPTLTEYNKLTGRDAAAPAAEPAAPAKRVRAKKDTPPDPRFTPVRERIFAKHKERFGVDQTWGGPEGGTLAKWLKESPNIPLERVLVMVDNVYASDRDPGRPCSWLHDLGKWANSPLDQFGNAKRDSRIEAQPIPISNFAETQRRKREAATADRANGAMA